jgi:hypothetical protein
VRKLAKANRYVLTKVVDGTNCHGDEDECEVCISKCPDQKEKEAKI